MSTFLCPNCGEQKLRSSNGTAFYTCDGCVHKFVIVEMPPNVIGMFNPLNAQLFGTLNQKERDYLDGLLNHHGEGN